MAFARTLTFADPFQFQTAIRAAEIEIIPTGKGEFRAELTQATLNKLWMQRLSENLPRVHKGSIKRGRRIFSFLTEEQPEVYHCGRLFERGELIADDFDVQHAVTAGDYRLGSVSLTPEDLVAACQVIVGRNFDTERSKHFVRPDPQLMGRLLRLHEMTGEIAKNTPELLEMPEVARALEQQLIHALVRCLTEGDVSTLSKGTLHTEIIVARFEEFLEANPNTPLYLAEVCAAVGSAERTLRAACEQHLGIGPIRYLTLRRMHLVRRALVRATSSTATVTQIATDHGFWELGRFAVAYRTLFGETPSVTLSRQPDDIRGVTDRPSSLEGMMRFKTR
ncbi:helix-turn-helix domain-containing protein [Bradyrhizobium sp. 521_C7_N1_3]|uniref:helix-turn-helix domain-containing protein n=1 Tax=Bradyrhizobium sp. 521_C7_N1_3 TaxID=3240368 RepID=UPI003F88F136